MKSFIWGGFCFLPFWSWREMLFFYYLLLNGGGETNYLWEMSAMLMRMQWRQKIKVYSQSLRSLFWQFQLELVVNSRWENSLPSHVYIIKTETKTEWLRFQLKHGMSMGLQTPMRWEKKQNILSCFLNLLLLCHNWTSWWHKIQVRSY